MNVNGINLQNFSYNLRPGFCTRPKFPETKDTVSFSGNKNVKYIDENALLSGETLLEGCTSKSINNFNEMSPKKMVMVHMTNYFPSDGEIKPVNIATKDENGKARYRSTVHFAINHSVEEHLYGGNWQHMKYAVLLPMDGVLQNVEKENVLGGKLEDFFIKGSVKLPDNSVIIKYNPEIPNGKMKIVNASETMEDFCGTKGIKIIETSNPDTGALANKMIGKMGYINLQDLTNSVAGLADEECKVLRDAEYGEKLQEEDLDRYEEIIAGIDFSALDKAAEYKDEAWAGLCGELDVQPWQHAYSPWGRSEMLIEAIKLVGINGDSWKKDITTEVFVFDDEGESESGANSEENFGFSFGKPSRHCEVSTIDYQQEFLKVIDEIKAAVPKGKSLSFDIDILKDIIENAETPFAALDEIEDRLNLRVMVDNRENDDSISNADMFSQIDTLLCLSNMQKELLLQDFGE